MQIVAIPLFNKEMGAEAYIFRDFKNNLLFSQAQAIGQFDGASKVESLRVLDEVGLDSFTLGKPIFVPIQEVALMGNLPTQCRESAEKIVFVLEKPFSNRDLYLPLMTELTSRGYRFAINYSIDHAPNDPVLASSSFILLSQRGEKIQETHKTLDHVRKYYRNLAPIATHIHTKEILKSAYGKNYSLYESKLYKTTSAEKQIGPLKVNAIRLINTIQDENFDFDEVTKAVKGDPALTISLFKLVNTSSSIRNKINSIQHAVAMMGQREVRKWVTTAVSRSMGNDRPNEITRVSLLRAKFLENLAPIFEMTHMSGELFLLGLFSVIDNLLELPMEEALKQVVVSENIRKALVDETGIYHPILTFAKEYESASWDSISRAMIVNDIKSDQLFEAYLGALTWYRDLIAMDAEPDEPAELGQPEKAKK